MRLPVSLPHLLAGVAAFLVGAWFVRRGGGGGPLGPELELDDPVDAYATKELATGCSNGEQEGTQLFRRWALERWGEREGSPRNIMRACGGKPDEHQEGRAWDLMTRSLEHGQQIVDDLTAPSSSGEPDELARRAGIMYMIWNRRMWRAYPHGGAASGEWGPYTGPNPHMDHVHISFGWPGARAETSLYPRIRRELGVA